MARESLSGDGFEALVESSQLLILGRDPVMRNAFFASGAVPGVLAFYGLPSRRNVSAMPGMSFVEPSPPSIVHKTPL